MPDDIMQYRELDLFLMRRKRPAVPEGLSERIIAAAMRYEAEQHNKVVGAKTDTLWHGLMRAFGEMLYVPRPAYVIATVLVMGISLGVYGDALSAGFMPGITTDELSSFMRIEDRFVASEFLNGGSL